MSELPNPVHPDLETILSTARFGTYLAWAGDERERGVALYTLNAAVSESFYTSLHMLEVALRNRIHAVLQDAAGETWFDVADYQATRVRPKCSPRRDRISLRPRRPKRPTPSWPR